MLAGYSCCTAAVYAAPQRNSPELTAYRLAAFADSDAARAVCGGTLLSHVAADNPPRLQALTIGRPVEHIPRKSSSELRTGEEFRVARRKKKRSLKGVIVGRAHGVLVEREQSTSIALLEAIIRLL